MPYSADDPYLMVDDNPLKNFEMEQNLEYIIENWNREKSANEMQKGTQLVGKSSFLARN